MHTRVDRLNVYNPNCISVYDIERMIDKGIRFDIVDGLQPDEYDVLEKTEEVTDE